ncbi:MAG TPA: Calx-beta domain-containing protein, partial [Nitrospira sp.]|nr:Calx-beta domain-containing protein [Nitrospira sp.]
FNGDGRPEVAFGLYDYFLDDGAVAVLLNNGDWVPPLPSLRINDVTVTEGNTGTLAANFTVTLAAASTETITVTYATGDGSATAGSDYQTASGTLTIPAGQTSGTITVLVNGDRLAEYDEYFTVNLTSATGALITSGTGYETIQDDEPRIRINSVSVTEGNSGTKLMTFTVTLSTAYDQAVTVNYATHDNSATVADNDYVATSGTLTFAPGQTTKTFTVTIKGDKKKESDESFYVLLSGASSNALIDNAYGWGTILNDDGPTHGSNRK